MAELKFPSPHEAERIQGPRGGSGCTPIITSSVRMIRNARNTRKGMFWFYDGLHYPEPMYPFDIIWDEPGFLRYLSSTPGSSLSHLLWYRSTDSQRIHLHHSSGGRDRTISRSASSTS